MIVVRVAVLGAILVAAAALQTSLFPALTLLGFRPDLLILVVLGIALRDGPLVGVRVGAVAGLLADLLVLQSPVGLSMLVYTAIGYLVGLVRPYLAPGSITAPLLLAFTTGAAGTAAYGLMTSLLGEGRITPSLLVQASLAIGLYNTLLAPLVLWLLRRVTDRFPASRTVAPE